jgi:glucuronoarabinoxylan endo-1,4-beta-xylanase
MIFEQKILIRVTIILSILLSVNVSAQEVVKVDFTKTYQKIDGFGASTAWHGQLSDKEADVSFGNGDDQLGLSIIRLRIDPNGQNNWHDELVNAKKAIKRGAIVFASPWTPPASMKTNNNVVSGELRSMDYGSYVDYLNSYIQFMEENEAPLSAISLQNEPNIKVKYESCDWSSAQMVEFCKLYAQNINAPVVVPEAFNFDQAFSDPILNDPTAVSNIAIIGGHLYGTTVKSYPLAQEKEKPVWMTEHYLDNDDITTCMTMAKEISDCMNCNMSAYIWWWLRQPSCNLITSGGNTILKKGYIMAQFSKFVRPGYFRTGITYNTYKGMNFSSFSGEKQVIVAVNRSMEVKSVQFEMIGDTTLFFQRYITSTAKSLKKGSTIEISNHILNVELEPQSVTTFVSAKEAYDPAAVEKARISKSISVYPNPVVSGTFSLKIDLPSQDFPFDLRILTMEGRTVYAKRIEKNFTEVETNLKPAIYTVRLTGNSMVHNQKLIIK